MVSYLILQDEKTALARSKEAYITDTVTKRGLDREALSLTSISPLTSMANHVTQYRWAADVGKNGMTALIIDGDEQLLTAEEQAKLITDLPDDEGENWEKPPPPDPPININGPGVRQEGSILTSTAGTWEDPQPDTLAYQWRKDGNENIGTDAAEYTITPADVGRTVTCFLTGANAFGSTSVESNPVVVAAPA